MLAFRYRRRVAFAETDLTGGLHFANLFRYFEETEQALFRRLEVPLLWRREDGLEQGWPRVAAECELLEAIALGDELEITAAVVQVRHSSVRLQFEVFRAAEPATPLVARGFLRLACIAAGPGQPMRAAPIPEPFAERLRSAITSPTR